MNCNKINDYLKLANCLEDLMRENFILENKYLTKTESVCFGKSEEAKRFWEHSKEQILKVLNHIYGKNSVIIGYIHSNYEHLSVPCQHYILNNYFAPDKHKTELVNHAELKDIVYAELDNLIIESTQNEVINQFKTRNFLVDGMLKTLLKSELENELKVYDFFKE